MRRLNPIGSLFGIVMTVLLLVGLGISLWVNRGLAFNPGPTTATSKEGIEIQGFTSHAEFEKRCVFCHEPLKSDLATKCMICHTDVSAQIQTNKGVHSQIINARDCASCHPEHRGRDFNPTNAAYKSFDHSKTSFSLNWHQENYDTTPMQCEACHNGDDFKIVQNQTCLDCHSTHDVNFAQSHVSDFGSNCLACHDGVDKMQNFDHSNVGFPLEGKHQVVKCTSCHTTDDLSNAPADCMSCHKEPTTHQGIFTQTCESCHTSQGWSPALIDNQPFSHVTNTRFSLVLHQMDYNQQIITCKTCHLDDLKSLNVQICIDCHQQHDEKFMTNHLQQFGTGCMTCHDGVDRLHNFNHANFFPLDGKHADINCLDCHINNVYRGTPVECYQCHKEPEIHAGLFGLKCNYCHKTDAWSPASLIEHTFPLNHGLSDPNASSKCEACHTNSYVEYTCYTCHEHDPAEITQAHLNAGIPEQDIPDCMKCHSDGIVHKDG